MEVRNVERTRTGCDIFMGFDMKLAKREEKALLRAREQENTRTKAHRCSEIADNRMESSAESSDIHDISDQPGPSSAYYPEFS
ncbi:hypothetical protein AVEN_114867-1 [Araneus ventricosus]|uniref:Uncharacterized protein n=1 Tax=Araneus ventricosus TaxID=182803 RepID=A0A4Y2DC44_ARAVE|nr:hypothetical protein AVEN_114867-1 [Araneus ventricosus]